MFEFKLVTLMYALPLLDLLVHFANKLLIPTSIFVTLFFLEVHIYLCNCLFLDHEVCLLDVLYDDPHISMFVSSVPRSKFVCTYTSLKEC